MELSDLEKIRSLTGNKLLSLDAIHDIQIALDKLFKEVRTAPTATRKHKTVIDAVRFIVSDIEAVNGGLTELYLIVNQLTSWKSIGGIIEAFIKMHILLASPSDDFKVLEELDKKEPLMASIKERKPSLLLKIENDNSNRKNTSNP